jgi:hypothetical protein
MKPEWELLPHQGLGPVRFGMTRDEAVTAGSVFGPITLEHAEEDDSLFKILIETMNEDEARALIASMAAEGIDMRPKRMISFSPSLQMQFFGDELKFLMVLPRSVLLHVEGIQIFGTDPLPALLRLQALNGARPQMYESSCLFDTLNVATWDMAITSKKGLLRLATSIKGRGLERAIHWGSESPVFKPDLSKYARVDLAPLAASAPS